MSAVTVLHARQALLPEGWVDDVAIEVVDGRIRSLTPASGAHADVRLDGVVHPGLVDTHVHGGGGATFSTTDPDEARTVIAAHARTGTTTMVAGLVTAEIDQLVEQIRALRPLVLSGELAGLYLEGPFLGERRCGAHDPALLRDPAPELLDPLLAAADGTLTMITLAPERGGALEAIARCTAAGVNVAIGHTTADAALAGRAVDAGARVATHLFNAMEPIHHRAPGPVPRLLTDPRVVVELIADGVHLAEDVLSLAIATAGPRRTILITDAMAAAGAGDGRYRLGALDVRVREKVARVVDADGAEGSIAGSTLTLSAAVDRVAGLPGLDLATALTMATATPARAHGLDEVGQLAVGRWADLVHRGEDGSVLDVLRRGRRADH